MPGSIVTACADGAAGAFAAGAGAAPAACCRAGVTSSEQAKAPDAKLTAASRLGTARRRRRLDFTRDDSGKRRVDAATALSPARMRACGAFREGPVKPRSSRGASAQLD